MRLRAISLRASTRVRRRGHGLCQPVANAQAPPEDPDAGSCDDACDLLACQGAQSEIAGLPDEAVSIGAALLAAGAACVIPALWPVHDAATALMMVRLYEHLSEDVSPPEALRSAQQWLRELTEHERFTFEAAHPFLREELRRLPTDPADPAGFEPLAAHPAMARPFAHPDFWAGFIAMGS